MMHCCPKETDLKELPSTLQRFIKTYPEVWSAHEKLGIETTKAGPLNEKTIQLIKLAVTGSQMLETAYKTHVKKAVEAGATRAEIEHAIIQLLPIVGMGITMMAMKWYHESTSKELVANSGALLSKERNPFTSSAISTSMKLEANCVTT